MYDVKVNVNGLSHCFWRVGHKLQTHPTTGLRDNLFLSNSVCFEQCCPFFAL